MKSLMSIILVLQSKQRFYLLISRYNTSLIPGQEYSGYRIYKNTKRNVSISLPKWW